MKRQKLIAENIVKNSGILTYLIILMIIRTLTYLLFIQSNLMLFVSELLIDFIQSLILIFVQHKNQNLIYAIVCVINKTSLHLLQYRICDKQLEYAGFWIFFFSTDLNVYLKCFSVKMYRNIYYVFTQINFFIQIMIIARQFENLNSQFWVPTMGILSSQVFPYITNHIQMKLNGNQEILCAAFDPLPQTDRQQNISPHNDQAMIIKLQSNTKDLLKGVQQNKYENQLSIEQQINLSPNYMFKKQRLNESPINQNMSPIGAVKLDNWMDKLIPLDASGTIQQEYREVYQQIWNHRINLMPIGIALIKQGCDKFHFSNRHLQKLLKKNVPLLNNKSNYEFDEYLLNKIKMKIIPQKNDEQHTRRNQFQQLIFRSKNLINSDEISQKSLFHSNRSIAHTKKNINQVIDDVNRELSLSEIFNNIENKAIQDHINTDDNTLEMICQIKSTDSLKLHCKLLVPTQGDVEYTFIVQDITKQFHLQKLEERGIYKSKLIQSFSHELRTPLNSAILFTQACIDDMNIPESAKYMYLKPSLSSLQLQESLVQDIIDFCQIEAHKIQLDIKQFQLTELIDDLVEIFRYQIQMKSMGLAFDIEEKVPLQITTDCRRLKQILINLIQNSIKFSKAGYIFIKIQTDDRKQISFTVQDEGIGMNDYQIKYIQRMLNSQKAKRSSDDEWSGFGLVISQMLVRILIPTQNSPIKIMSNGYQQGTQIQFSIWNNCTELQQKITKYPLLKKHSSVPNLSQFYGLNIKIQAKSESTLVLKKMYMSLNYKQMKPEELQETQTRLYLIQNYNEFNDNNYTFIEGISRKTTSLPCECRNILSVDDEIFNQISLGLILKKMGYSVDMAYNGQQAIDLVLVKDRCSKNCCVYKFILMDCQMAIMNGWDASEQLCALMKDMKIPRINIFGITAFTGKEDIEKCYRSGMKEVIQKPLNKKHLESILNKYKIN